MSRVPVRSSQPPRHFDGLRTRGWILRIRRTEHTSAGVVATRACPRISETSSGFSGSSPITSAAMSSGTEAIGSTRPFAPRSLATMSRPATGSPSRSHSPTMSRFPIA